MFGILSNSIRVATREDHWGSGDWSRRSEKSLPPHWRQRPRDRFEHMPPEDRLADPQTPKLARR